MENIKKLSKLLPVALVAGSVFVGCGEQSKAQIIQDALARTEVTVKQQANAAMNEAITRTIGKDGFEVDYGNHADVKSLDAMNMGRAQFMKAVMTNFYVVVQERGIDLSGKRVVTPPNISVGYAKGKVVYGHLQCLDIVDMQSEITVLDIEQQ